MAQKTWHQSELVEKHETCINGQNITYTVKRSLKAKRVRLEVRQQTGLTIIVPHFYEIGRLHGLIQSKERWISRNLSRYSHSQSLSVKKELRSGDTVPYLGRDLKLVKQENHDSFRNVTLEANTLAVSPDLFKNGILELALEQWYRREAAKLINEKADKLSSNMGISYKRIVIRGQRTRWGSCSQRKNLSFNW
jgi:predicted metal-dependent hydrolase